MPLAELPATGIGPTGVAVAVAPVGALLVPVAMILAVFEPWAKPVPTPLTRATDPSSPTD